MERLRQETEVEKAHAQAEAAAKAASGRWRLNASAGAKLKVAEGRGLVFEAELLQLREEHRDELLRQQRELDSKAEQTHKRIQQGHCEELQVSAFLNTLCFLYQ